jgi:thiol-disulfide isomerase/thioredoxin
MKNPIYKLFILLSVGLLFSCEKKNNESAESAPSDKSNIAGYVVKGNIKGLKADTVYLVKVGKNSEEPIQKVVPGKNGSFTFTGRVESPEFYRVKLSNSKGIDLVFENETFSFSADANNPEATLKVKGSRTNRDIQAFIRYFNSEIKRRNSLQERFLTLQMQPDEHKEEIEAIQKKLEAIEGEKEKYAQHFIDSIFPSKAIFFIVPVLNKEEYIDYQYELSKRLLKEYPDLTMAKNYAGTMENIVAQRNEYLEKQKNSPISEGKEVPDIALPDPEGKVVKLSDLKGKYVLIDFWASWCGPCRAENPNVVKTFEKYKDKGFRIYSVSLDASKEAWLKAIQKDNLQHEGWYHVSDLKQWESSVVPDYGLHSIPFTVLLDKNGKVIAKNLRGAQLEEKLKEVL